MKRQGRPDNQTADNQAAKRRKISETAPARITAGDGAHVKKSLYEEAAPYLITTARVPFDALDPTWSQGTNRPINKQHVQRLYEILVEQTPDRESAEHHIRGKCKRADVDRMLRRAAAAPHSSTAPYARFDLWSEVNESKIELIAGQHRLQAFAEYARREKLPPDELWWVCEIYDDDMPSAIDVKLRANRTNATLPDSHGRIWAEAAALAASQPSFFVGTSTAVEREMVARLKLDSRVRFPISRMVTLWQNRRWRGMISRWCATSLGEATFNISTWDEMARCRIDEVIAHARGLTYD